jgi:molybdate transport system regulatory protein
MPTAFDPACCIDIGIFMNQNDILPKPKVTVRLLHNDEIAMGPGKAQLLDAIQTTGSISAAGKSMKMSYRRAWMLVDVMNRSFAQPLVKTAKGGKDGGGAVLTPMGLQVLDSYKKMNNAIQLTMQAYLPTFAGMMAVKSAESLAETAIAEPEDWHEEG